MRREAKIPAEILLYSAAAAGALGQVFLYFLQMAAPGMILFAAAFILLWMRGQEGPAVAEKKPAGRTEAALLAAAIIVAAVFRFALIDQIPAGLFVDEAQNGAAAKSIIETNRYENTFLPVYITGHTHNPTGFIYILAAVIKAIGGSAAGIRIAAAITGITAVPVFYFLARALLGPQMALAGAFLLAVSRWHVNFSRTGFHCILAVTAMIFVLYFVVRAYRERKWGDFLAAGALLGLSQYTYTAARLAVFWMAAVLVYLVFINRAFLKENAAKIGAAAAVAALTALPMMKYASEHMGDFINRQTQISVFEKGAVQGFYGEKGTVAKALLDSVVNTAGMFNYKGDGNGRHNLPGKPQLDFLTGLAAALGLALCLYRLKKPENFLMVSFFAAFLSAGLFSLESPQALRTVITIPALIFFALVFIKELVSVPAFKRAALLITAAFVIAAGAENIYLYFGPQAHSKACRESFSTDEYAAAKYAESLKPGTRMIVHDFYFFSSTFRYVAGEKMADCENFDRDASIPLRPGIKGDAAYLLDRGFLPFAGVLKEIYPGAEIRDVNDPYSGQQGLFIGIKVPAGDIEKWNLKRGVHGLAGRYYHGLEWKGKPAFTEKRELMTFAWNQPPVPLPASAEWSGNIMTDAAGEYVFFVQCRDYAELSIDGKQIIVNYGLDHKIDLSKLEKGKIKLAKGLHSIRLRYATYDRFYRLILWWQPPGEADKKLVSPEVLYY